jgi:hypothetical protein
MILSLVAGPCCFLQTKKLSIKPTESFWNYEAGEPAPWIWHEAKSAVAAFPRERRKYTMLGGPDATDGGGHLEPRYQPTKPQRMQRGLLNGN